MDNGTYTNLGWVDGENDNSTLTNSNSQSINDVNQASIEQLTSDGDLWRYNNSKVEALNKGTNNQLLQSTTNNINWTSEITVDKLTTGEIYSPNGLTMTSPTHAVRSIGTNIYHIAGDTNNFGEIDNVHLSISQDGGLNSMAMDMTSSNLANLAAFGTYTNNLRIGHAGEAGQQDPELYDFTYPASYPAIAITQANDITIKNTANFTGTVNFTGSVNFSNSFSSLSITDLSVDTISFNNPTTNNYGSTQLNHYNSLGLNTGQFTTNVTGDMLTTGNIAWDRIGNLVSVKLTFSSSIDSTNNYMSRTVPVGFRPAGERSSMVYYTDNNNIHRPALARLTGGSPGSLELYAGLDPNETFSTGTVNYKGVTFSYLL